jgi:cytochrome c oxidase assembly protein subunit 15
MRRVRPKPSAIWIVCYAHQAAGTPKADDDLYASHHVWFAARRSSCAHAGLLALPHDVGRCVPPCNKIIFSGMNSQELYNLSPTLQLMIMGLVVAIGPLAWVWLKSRNSPIAKRLRMLTWVTLFLTFDLVIFGAFTRLTDSGLGCPDWPGCYGHASPVGAKLQINAAQAAMPTGPVTHPKAWIEMIHRYLATGVGVLILTLAVTTWLEQWRQARRDAGPTLSAMETVRGSELAEIDTSKRHLSVWWPTFTLFWVCLQGAFGALTVTMKLFPAIVTLHLLGSMVLLALLKSQSAHYEQANGGVRDAVTVPLNSATRQWLFVTFTLLWLQIALGGWVSTNYAVLACTDFPACQNSLWPAMNFAEGFTLWRELGAGLGGENISFQALTAIHYAHRLSAYLVFAALLVLAAKLYKIQPLRNSAKWLAGLALLQIATGLGNVLLGWPLFAAVMHTGGAAALVVALTGILCASRSATDTVSASKFSSSRLFA